MNKEQLFQELSVKIDTGEISREEIATRFGAMSTAQPAIQSTAITDGAKTTSPFAITKVLYVLGASIVVIGIVIFIAQIWSDLDSFMRIAITLGLGLIIAALGSMLLKRKPDESIGTVFHFIGGMIIPGGALVTLSEMNIDFQAVWPLVYIFGILFGFYLLLSWLHKNAILTFFAIANGTVFTYLLVEAMTDGSFYRHVDLYAYLTMIMGVSYLLLAHAFRENWNKKLNDILCLLGSTGFLGAAFTRVFDSGFWEILYFGIILGGFLLSVYIKSRSVLFMSTLFLIIHVSYITGEYFADSIGWPVSLVILGFVFIALGYLSVSINKKYISVKAA